MKNDETILVETLGENIKCVSNFSDNSLFIVTKDNVGHLYRFNDTCDTISEGYSTPIRFYKEKSKLIKLLFIKRKYLLYVYDR